MVFPCWRETMKFLILAAFFSSLFADITCTFPTQQEGRGAGGGGGGGGEQPPPISPSNAEVPGNRTRRLLLGTLCGAFAGFSAAVFAALLIRYSVLYLNTTPILKGPVIFCSRINNPKMLHLLVQQQQQKQEKEDDENPMNSSTQLLGSGVNGKYYRVVLENGMCVAIKKMEPCLCLQRKSVKRRIQEDMEVLGNLKHRNLMSLRAYANEFGRFSLVYDCMPNGSLEDVLKKVRSKQLHLNWETRHRIAVGIIKGLHFLHFEYDHTVYHYNLKPSNVLLDEDYSPRLSDFGLIRLLEEGVRGSVYTAPEFVLTNDFSDKSDVFSFGMVLAVLLMGRDPTDSFFFSSSAEGGGGGSIGKWLQHLQQEGKAIEGIDKDIVGDEGEEEEMLNAVRIAVVCMSEAAAVRPSADELVHLLTQLHSF